MLPLALALASNVALSLGVALVLQRWVGPRSGFSKLRACWLVLVGAAAGAACMLLERVVSQWAGAGTEMWKRDELGSLFTLLLFAAPLEEGAKVLLVRPLARRAQATGRRASVLLVAIWLCAGFALVESVYGLIWGQDLESFVRPLLRVLAHLFFAGLWAIAVGDYFRSWGAVWLLATTFHGLFDHLVNTSQGRVWLLTLPVLASAVGVSWLGLRDLRRRPFQVVEPSAGADRTSAASLGQRERVPLHWVLGGAFVTTGVVIALLALAIYVGHRLGLDFALADEADVRADGPIVLLAGGLATAFPLSGFLIAKASGTSSVIEPAMGAALAIGVVVLLLSVTAPVAVVFALAVAPLAFGLACTGAWFGVSR